MTRVARWVALFTLATFVGLTSAEAFHTHALLQADNTCTFCNLAHQTPAPSAPSIIPHVASVVGNTPIFRFAEPVLTFLVVSSGRSPPAL